VKEGSIGEIEADGNRHLYLDCLAGDFRGLEFPFFDRIERRLLELVPGDLDHFGGQHFAFLVGPPAYLSLTWPDDVTATEKEPQQWAETIKRFLAAA